MFEKVVLSVKNEDAEDEVKVIDESDAWLIGRASECRPRLVGPTVSRRHCLLEFDPPFITIRDLGSLNGTYVNGQRIDDVHDLFDGDEVGVGSFRFLVHVYQGDEPCVDSHALETAAT